jgi:acyl CoA:acetate/3-ketoacid CoA transferase alpha subunit
MAEITTLREAVAELVHDGDSVALEGFTHLIPFAAGHEPIRQGRRHLTLVQLTPDLVYDQLIGMGCADRLVFSWGGNPGVGSLHRFRDAVEHGWPNPLEIEEHSHADQARDRDRRGGGRPARPRPHSVVLPSWMVTAVAPVPGGAHPSYAAGYSARDNAFYQAWDPISRDREAFKRWMERHALDTPRLGGIPGQPRHRTVKPCPRTPTRPTR